MELPWKEYVCNDCGNSSGILDVDRDIPKGWIITGRNTHYCDKCASKHKHEVEG